MHKKSLTLLPEWAEQEAVILAWPHENTDWANNLKEVQTSYVALIKAINQADACVLLLCPQDMCERVVKQLDSNLRVLVIPADYNDTWVRDYGFLTLSDNQHNYPISFKFNGWGDKFDAQLDNAINTQLSPLCQQKLIINNTVLEGGAIEMDENQHLLSTASCLYNPKRNGNMSASQYEALFVEHLGAKRVSIFNHGQLEGDDTDGHIDTLARFTPLMGIVLQCADNRPQDPHFAPLFKLQYEISQALPQHKIYSLPLPFVVDEDGHRLPASYANFLIINKQILMPIYNVAEDIEAAHVIQKAFPNYTIVQINCAPLVAQYGSLHCICMQVPTNTLLHEIIEKAQTGVNKFEAFNIA